MIKYKEIQLPNEYNKCSGKYRLWLMDQRSIFPVKLISHNHNILRYTIPNKQHSSRCMLHREDGPAYMCPSGYIEFWYYGTECFEERKFFDTTWRKRAEIRRFL